MKNSTTNSRREFLGALALGAAASGFSVLGNPMYANTKVPDFDTKTYGDPDEWFNNVKGSHRIVYDGSTPHDSMPVIWNWAFYLTNNQTGTPDEDITAMTVLRHNAIPFALKDSVWDKYKLGEFFKITDLTTGEPAVRNMVYEPGDGDFILPGIDGIKRLQERGAMFCVCDLALHVYSGFLAKGMDMEADSVYKEMADGVLPGIQIVPSGVWALGRAQEHGCGYIFAGG